MSAGTALSPQPQLPRRQGDVIINDQHLLRRDLVEVRRRRNGIAAEESLYLAGYARKVTMIHKGPALTVSPMLKERLDAEPKIHVLCNEEVEDVGGDELLSEIVLKNTKTGEETVLHADEEDGFFGLFGFTGKKTTGMFDGVLDMEGGYIKTDECMRTNIPGVFAAGDVADPLYRQAITAAAAGCRAAIDTEKYLLEKGL